MNAFSFGAVVKAAFSPLLAIAAAFITALRRVASRLGRGYLRAFD